MSRRRPSPLGVVLAVVVAVAVGLGGYLASVRGDGETPANPARDAAVPAVAEATALLAALPVKGRSPATGYDRIARFGDSWLDVDGNGCNTRDDILARDLTGISRRGDCRVTAGVLDDPYTGKRIDFVRGVETSALVQIDHVVALLDAWETGARSLSQDQRIRLANDPLNLMAVDGSTNQAKGAKNAASWLPPAKGYRCEYAARQIAVKAKYDLWITRSEKAALKDQLTTC